MLSPRCYATVARVAALALGVGSLSWSASDPERVRLLLGECKGSYHRGPSPDCPNCSHGIRWSGCDSLARELAMSGALLIVGSLPVKRSGEG